MEVDRKILHLVFISYNIIFVVYFKCVLIQKTNWSIFVPSVADLKTCFKVFLNADCVGKFKPGITPIESLIPLNISPTDDAP